MTVSPVERMLDVVGPLWSEAETSAALGLGVAELAGRRAAGCPLGLPSSDGDWFYPACQFEEFEDRVRVVPDLVDFLKLHRTSPPWAVGMMAATPADELDGLTPVEWARQGREAEKLLAFAHSLHSEWR